MFENFENYFNENFIDEAIDYTRRLSKDNQAYAERMANMVAEMIIKDVNAGKTVDIKEIKARYKVIVKNGGGWIEGADAAGYFGQLLEDKLAKAGITNKVTRQKKKEITYKNINNLSPEEFKEASEYFQQHVISIKFGIPTAKSEEAIRNRLAVKYTDKPEEWIDDKAEKLFAVFNNYKEEFENLFPAAEEGRDFWYRRAENKTDTDPHVDLWHMMAETRFDENIENAPVSVIKMMESAQAASKNEAKDMDAVKLGSVFNSYYFALAVLKMFDNDLYFYTKRRKNSQITGSEFDAEAVADSDDVFKQDFDNINAYGEKVESLAEGKEDKFTCCICGEECIGYGNNPEPFKHEGRCCDACNLKFVIPARLAELNKPKE